MTWYLLPAIASSFFLVYITSRNDERSVFRFLNEKNCKITSIFCPAQSFVEMFTLNVAFFSEEDFRFVVQCLGYLLRANLMFSL